MASKDVNQLYAERTVRLLEESNDLLRSIDEKLRKLVMNTNGR